jgi:drug/metabolite transporter (DMT)-like permease
METHRNFAGKNNLLPYLALAVTVIATSAGGMFIRWANAPGIVTVFYRTSISSLLVVPFFLSDFRKSTLSIKSTLPWLGIALFGGVLIALDQAAWASALLMTKMANTANLNSLAPLWVALFALVFFKEKLCLVFLFGLVFALSGSFLILGQDLLNRPSFGQGDLLGFLSSLFYGGYFIVTQIGRRKLNTLIYTWTATFSCAICLGLLNLVFHQSIIDYPLQSFLFFIGAALTSQVIGYFSMGYALGHLSATIVAPAMLAKPITVAVFAFIFFGEALSWWELIGGISVLIGLFFISQNRVKLSKEEVAVTE